jgi:allophanate hydrolase subunit 1
MVYLAMTRVQIQFRLERPLDDSLMARIAAVHSVYGIQRIDVAPSLDALTVEYDATRLRPPEVRGVLAGAGIPLAPK